MVLTLVDWLVIAGYFLLNLGIGVYYARRARGSTSEFFLSGRDVPWWLAGTSMVATTFAADTPLVVTGLVARNGIAGNWLWWSMAASGMLTVFVYARLWRRAGVMTDVEFAELRYAGPPAAFLRGFRALYLGVPINCIVIGWVNLAMMKILQVTLGLDASGALWALLGLLVFTAFYTTLAGLWGVLVTDLVQFVLKMGMVVALAFFAVRAVGGLDSLQDHIRMLDRAAGEGSRLTFFPSTDSAWMPAITLFVYLGVNWWASWYPGAEPGGGGYVAQRIFAARNERHGLYATLWFQIAHYAVRPWPWILTALASLVLYPTLVDKESGYVRTLMDPAVFPPSLRGIMLAAFAAAYMSTIGTQLNWGASYVVNDVYRRFFRRDRSEREYVLVSQAVHSGADGSFDLCHAASRLNRTSVEAVDRDRCRHRHRSSAAMVLVAHQRLVRGVGDGCCRRRVALPSDRAQLEQRRSARICLHHAGDGRGDDHRLADSHTDDAARVRGDARDVLPARSPAGQRVGANRARNRHHCCSRVARTRNRERGPRLCVGVRRAVRRRLRAASQRDRRRPAARGCRSRSVRDRQESAT
jgi:Na+/proline symporter